jgi:hypothetical protein
VAAFQWKQISGEAPTDITTAFINIVKIPLVGRPIQADLEAFDSYEARLNSRAVLCPYISMPYRTSTCIGCDGEVNSRGVLESADIASDSGGQL